MKVIDRYDFAENSKERFIETVFYPGESEYIGKSHTYSYLHCREELKSIGQTMGLDLEDE